MSINLIKKSIIPLSIATALLGGFFWQFPIIYSSIIQNFTEDRLYVLYSHLIIYTFLILILIVSIANLLNYFLLKSKIFIATTLISTLIFYLLSFGVLKDLFHYFIHFPLSESSLMGLVLFAVTSFGYALYSLIYPFFNRYIPLLHISIFTLFGLLYSAFFINNHCYPIGEIWSRF